MVLVPFLLAALPQVDLIDLNLAPPSAPTDGQPTGMARLGSDLLFAADVPGFGRELCSFDGQSVDVLADLWPGDSSGSPGRLTTIGNEVWFSAFTGGNGTGIWRTDGTGAGTELVFELDNGGPGLSLIEQFTGLGSLTLFFAYDPFNGFGVWRSDGTAAGTFPLVEFGTGTFIFLERPVTMIVAGSFAYFVTDDAHVLWRTDGTVAGTVAVTDPSWTNVRELVELNGDAYFTASDAPFSSSSFIARYDGNGAETLFAPETTDLGAFPRNLTPFGGEIYFSGRGAASADVLFRLDGNTNTPVFLVDSDPLGSAPPWQMTPADTYLAFTSLGNDATGEELWRTDGTVAGTYPIADAVPGPGDLAPEDLIAIGDTIVFRGTDANGTEPWYTDGNVVAPLGDLLAPGSSDPDGFYFDGTEIWFAADDALLGRELWSTDGTPGGTALAADAGAEPASGGSEPTDFTRLGTRVLFTADDGVHGRELWTSDGSQDGTELLVDAFPGPVGSDPSSITVVGDRAYFLASIDVIDGFKDFVELWVTDGTAAGTERISDLGAAGQFDAEALVAAGGRLWFTATDFGPLGREPFSSDGEAGGVQSLGNLNPSTIAKDSEAVGFTAAGDTVLFRSRDVNFSYSLFRSDGSAAGTFPFEVEPGAEQPFQPSGFAPFTEGRVLFSASSSGGFGFELWISDGTPAGTVRISDIEPGPNSSLPKNFFVLGDTALFTARNAALGDELWRTDGQLSGTSLLADFEPGPDDTDIDFLGTAGGRAIFRTKGNGIIWDLWASDGTAAGTVELQDLPELPGTRGPDGDAARAGDEVFFLADTAFEQQGLYRTDGTPAGTVGVFGVVAPIEVEGLTAIGSGSELVLMGTDDAGAELWSSRGTPATTGHLADIELGAGGSYPQDFVRVGNRVLFTADLVGTGRELVSLPLAETEAWVAEPFGVACPGTGGLAPTIGADGTAQLGETVDVTLSDGLGLSTAFLFFDFGASPLPAGDCTQYVGLSSFLYAVTATDVDGSAAVATPLPAGLTGLLNVSLYFQWAVVDPGGGFAPAIALSDVLEVIIGPPL